MTCVRWFIVCLAAAALPLHSPLAAEATHPTLRDAKLPPLLDARIFFFQRAERGGFALSPDGNHLAWQQRRLRGFQLHVQDLRDGSERTFRLRRPGRSIRWALDNRHLIFFRDRGGDENYMLFLLDTEDPDAPPSRMTPFDGVKASLIHMLPDDPANVVISMNARDRSLFDLHRLNILTGKTELVEKNPGNVFRWIVDRKGYAVARYRRAVNGDQILESRLSGARTWKKLRSFGFDMIHGLNVVSHDGTHAFGRSGLGGDTAAVVRVDLRDGKEEVLYRHPKTDFDWLWFDEDTARPLMTRVWDGYPKLHFFDPKLGEDLAEFRGDGPADIRIVSRSRDLRRLVVRVSTDRTRRSIYLFDRTTRRKALLTTDIIGQHKDSLSPMQPFSFTARDGLLLHGYLNLPQGTKGRKLPMVLNAHGGPWARHEWRYDGTTQFLANRGYAVLTVNYRGSTGYGRAFRQAIRGEVGRKTQDDLIDGVRWAIGKGFADPGKVAIYGRSFGGYATLAGLAFTPEIFAAGVDIVGVAALTGIKSKGPPYWKLGRHWIEYLGDSRQPGVRATLRARSPLYSIDRIKRPLLVIHGANDVRVPLEHSDRVVKGLRKLGRPVEYLVFDNEGHQIRRPPNRLRMMQAVETFLARHLGGRSGP